MKLKEIRIKNNITQKKLANDLKYNQTLVSMWEHNKREPSNKALIELANYFNVTIDDLVGRDFQKVATPVYTKAQQNLVDKVKYLNDDQCLTLCSIIDTFGNDNKQILSDYNQLKKYED